MPKILMTGTIWTVIMNLDVPESPDSSTAHLCNFWLLFRTVPASAELTDQATIQNHYSRKARGQDTVHKQWPVTVHSNSTPDRIMKLLFAFGWQDNSPEVKAIYLPWFQLSSEGSKALSFYIRHPWLQSSLDFLGPFRLLKVIKRIPLRSPLGR